MNNKQAFIELSFGICLVRGIIVLKVFLTANFYSHV